MHALSSIFIKGTKNQHQLLGKPILFFSSTFTEPMLVRPVMPIYSIELTLTSTSLCPFEDDFSIAKMVEYCRFLTNSCQFCKDFFKL